MKTFLVLLAALLVSTDILAKPATTTGDDVLFRSPGKPAHPLQLGVDIEASRLVVGVATEGRLVVRSAVPVENLEVILRPSPGMQASSAGVLERSVARLGAEESLALPLRLQPTGADARQFVVELRAIDPSGRVLSREIRVDLDARTAVRPDKPRQPGSLRAPEPAGVVLVPAEQELIRGN